MAAYGTVQMSSAGASTEGPESGVGTRRPWREMFNLQSINLPANFHDAISRIQTNAAYFRTNYVIVVLLIVYLSLQWHPFSLIVFVPMTWLFVYFGRYGRTIRNRTVIFAIYVEILVFLPFNRAMTIELGSLAIGGAFLLIHAALRNTDDLYADEESGGLLTGAVGSSSS